MTERLGLRHRAQENSRVGSRLACHALLPGSRRWSWSSPRSRESCNLLLCAGYQDGFAHVAGPLDVPGEVLSGQICTGIPARIDDPDASDPPTCHTEHLTVYGAFGSAKENDCLCDEL